ncbi:MAG: ATP-binding cassette domain-containing protein [Planctomycetes bacterium]|nr:ATP-binding cassette domain-containing protein [Planctomycetota bacterium]
MPDHAPEVAFTGVSLRYPNGVQALDGVTFSVPAGTICALMGGSGSGKTTLLKLVNRVEHPCTGQVCLDGRPVDNADPVVLRRSIGYVIQEGGLFPHWSAARNVGLVPRLLGCDQRTTDELVISAMDLARIPHAEFGRRRPDQLSGGQRQRVAIARAIAARPRLLLLDEPFGALDPAIRSEMQDELRALVKRLGCTVILVTHDIAEAFAVADRIALIDRGRLVQIGSPVEIALRPSDAVAAAFTAKQALELRLRYLRLADVAAHLPACAGDGTEELPGERTIADALGALARTGGERFTVLHQGRRLGPFERRAVWDLLQRGAA